MKLIFSTANQHKLRELRQMMPQGIELSIPADHGLTEDIPENEPTLEGNAHTKSSYIWDRLAVSCFADDTGLEVEALDGAPGVYSARYAGEHCSFDDNINLLLKNMDGMDNRRARFRTVISLIIDGTEHQFQGHVDGHISTERMDSGEGFGYDPIFVPQGYNISFSQMTPEQKNSISHRGRATAELIKFLEKLEK